jgi:toxin-antitoxin system PIN domain toxin
MLSFDTNLVVHACNTRSPHHARASAFLESLANRDDVVVCELMLVEVYLKIRNPAILTRPYPADEAVAYCHAFRSNPRWALVESAPIMPEVWGLAAQPDFAFRRIIDARLALTLRHHGVTECATTNTKDFAGFGFIRVWNPLEENA